MQQDREETQVVATVPGDWEIATQIRRFLGRLRWGVRLLAAGAVLLLVAEVASVYRLFHDVHPWVGVAAAAAFTGAMAYFVGRPLREALLVPRAVRPPLPPALGDRGPEHVEAQLEYLRRYLRNLRRNPEMQEWRERIDEAAAELEGLGEPGGIHASVHESIVDFERLRVLPLLEPLDAKVDALIYREALAVGTSTALSPNGTLDVFLVLWRNANLTATITRIYYGRPGFRGTSLVLRDVASAILLASVMERVSDVSASLLRKVGEGGRTVPLLGAVVGPAVDGLVNALMTMKLGYLAKERCRSFQGWDGRTKSNAIQRTFRTVSRAGATLFDELLRQIDRPLAGIKRTADTGIETVSDLSSRTLDFLKGLRSVFGKT